MGVVWGWALVQKMVRVVGAISGDGKGWRSSQSLVIGGINMAVEMVTVEVGGMLTWQRQWWRWLEKGGPTLTWQLTRGQ